LRLCTSMRNDHAAGDAADAAAMPDVALPGGAVRRQEKLTCSVRWP
jgi:hypothetical protein